MRTRNQLFQKLDEAYKQSPARFHAKIDSAYAQYLGEFNETQRIYATRVRDIAGEDCFSGFSHTFPDASLTELIQIGEHAVKRGTWALISIYEISFSLFRNAVQRSRRKGFYILAEFTRNEI